MVIPTVPREPLFWQCLAPCDYFQTSLEIGESDISKVVGMTGYKPQKAVDNTRG